MPEFRYQAKAGPGQVKNGVMEADNRFLVAAKLKQEGLFPLAIEEIEAAKSRMGRMSSRDISSFTRQLSDLLCSGFTLTAALDTLASQARTPGMGRFITDISRGIEKGREFSGVLACYPDSFSGFYVSMVKIGEAGGKLDESLTRLADFKEREEELQGQLRSALAYPAFLLLVGIISILVLVAFFIPRLAQLFADFDQVLPFSTRAVIFAGSLLGRFWWAGICLIFVSVFAVRSFLSRERNRLVVDTAVLAVPVLRNLVMKMESGRFSYALGILLKSGIPILDGLNIAALNVSNRRMRATIGSFQERIRKGHSLSSCLKGQTRFFPEMLYRMTAVGEESGTFPEMLLKAASQFENDVSRMLKSAVSLLEPCMVLFIGGVMVAIVFSILLPVFQLDFFPR